MYLFSYANQPCELTFCAAPSYVIKQRPLVASHSLHNESRPPLRTYFPFFENLTLDTADPP